MLKAEQGGRNPAEPPQHLYSDNCKKLQRKSI